MGQSQSSSKIPIVTVDAEKEKNFSDSEHDEQKKTTKEKPFSYPTPTGKEYDLIDNLASELPSIIDDESRKQVEEYIAGCDNGNGPMVACHSTAEYLSLFERKHIEAMKLYENCCFRDLKDKSPNGVQVGTGNKASKAYAPSCYNLAQFRMTGKGRTKFDRLEGYNLFERGCLAGHDPSCFMQAKMLCSRPDSFLPGEKIPYDPIKGMELYERVCQNGDSIACFTLATMLLRGDKIKHDATNVTPMEARGETVIQERTNEQSRRVDDDSKEQKQEGGKQKSIPRDPKKAESLLIKSCNRAHAPSCFNLAVMYNMGDDGVPRNQEKSEEYQKKTQQYVKSHGGFGFGGSRQ